jgi:murein DD-endopeptidase MepM/ murein hydrolase activator NlpD
MQKGLGLVLLCFLMIAGAYYVSTILGTLLAFRPNPPVESSFGLPSVNVNFFGNGKAYVTQGYGVTPYSYLYKDHWHDGVDLAANYGEAIYSPNAGTVIATGNEDDYCYHLAFGKYIAVKDPVNNLILWYAHLGTILVSPGQAVIRGTELGTVGATGYETGVHLHFSIFEADGFAMKPAYGCGPEPIGQDVDPLDYLGTTYK